jgi:hypothetical protein
MLAGRTRDLLRFRRGAWPAGEEFRGKRVAAARDGGRVRLRTVITTVRGAGTTQRRPFQVEWRAPKRLIPCETDETGRRAKGCRPIIEGTPRGPAALSELRAFHRHRLGAAAAKVVTITAAGASGIGARWDGVIAQVGLEPVRVVAVRDWCHAGPHLSPAVQASGWSAEERTARSARLRRSLKNGRSQAVIAELEARAADQPEGASVGRAIGSRRRPSEAGRLRYDCFRCRGVPLGSGAIASTIRRVRTLGLKGTSLFWEAANAEAVIQRRAAVLSGRWEERVEQTREARAKDRRTDWNWEPPECLAELKAPDEGDEESAQPSRKKQSKPIAA